MKRFSIPLSVLVSVSALGFAHAAENMAMKPTASATLAASAAVKAANGKVKAPVATAGTAIGKAGDSTIPSGSLPIPPKPKKDAIEAATVKANVAKP